MPMQTRPASATRCIRSNVIRLPQTNWIYQPPENSPAPDHLAVDGSITFGCFNTLAKISEPMLVLVGPDPPRPARTAGCCSRRLGLSSPRHGAAEFGTAWLPEGIDQERVELGVAGNRRLADIIGPAYNRVDIALDPYPYPRHDHDAGGVGGWWVAG